jgi:hypothetical protein
MNPVPVMFTVVFAAPATTEDGLMDVTAGSGFCAGGGGVDEPDPPPPQALRRKVRQQTAASRTHLARFMAGPVQKSGRFKNLAGTAESYLFCVYFTKYLSPE